MGHITPPPAAAAGAPDGGTSTPVEQPVVYVDADRAITADDLGALIVDNDGNVTLTVTDDLPTGFWFDVFCNRSPGSATTVAFGAEDFPNQGDGTVSSPTTTRIVNLGDIYDDGSNYWSFVSLNSASPSSLTLDALTVVGPMYGADDVFIGVYTPDGTKGPVVYSPNGHAWRGTIDNAGVFTWTDIG